MDGIHIIIISCSNPNWDMTVLREWGEGKWCIWWGIMARENAGEIISFHKSETIDNAQD